jgi:methylated-DNA-[protein]-cysteine S-methyltransferase
MTAETGAPAARHTVFSTRLGELTVVRDGGSLTGLYFPRHWPRPDRTRFGARTEDGFAEVARQLAEYLAGTRSAFDLAMRAEGDEFDRRVWDLIARVPYGQTTTYGDLARRLGGADPREVGAATGRNPLCILIPCHRVLSSAGQLTGYAGGLGRKRALLEIERAASHGTAGTLVYGMSVPDPERPAIREQEGTIHVS